MMLAIRTAENRFLSLPDMVNLVVKALQGQTTPKVVPIDYGNQLVGVVETVLCAVGTWFCYMYVLECVGVFHTPLSCYFLTSLDQTQHTYGNGLKLLLG
jgi:hypothetical protein